MQRRKKPRAKTIPEEEEKLRDNHKLFIDSDDEANEDLTLKIIEKALARENCNSYAPISGGDFEGEGDVVIAEGVLTSDSVKKKKRKDKKKKKEKSETETEKSVAKEKRKRKKSKKEVDGDEVVSEIIELEPTPKAEELVDASIDSSVLNLSEPNAAEESNPDNVVLRRLLRGPRYFDPPDKSWGACFNCGEDGHTAVNCTSARRKRPCHVCGSLEHEVKQCPKSQDCYVCNGQGHRARDCPQKMKRCSQASDLCLKCGLSGHVMFLCNNDYSTDDLKDIQCYVCKKFGHLCCENYLNALESDASCYKCGHRGHHGQDCRGSRGETSNGGTPSLCFKCEEEGHFARDCTSAKAKKRTRDSITPVGKSYLKDKNWNKGYNSAPQDFFAKSHRKKFHYDDEDSSWSSKPKRRGGWIPDDTDDRPFGNDWRSPSTPNKNHRTFHVSSGGHGHGHGSSPQSFRNKSNYSSGSSSSRRYDRSFENSYSASRFGHASSSRRNDNWW